MDKPSPLTANGEECEGFGGTGECCYIHIDQGLKLFRLELIHQIAFDIFESKSYLVLFSFKAHFSNHWSPIISLAGLT